VTSTGSPSPLGRRVSVRVETPRGAFVKRDWIDGRLRASFVSPIPCPFDYGTVVGEASEDGLGRDAVWLGAAKRPLEVAEGVVAAVARFRDAGAEDDKWIVSETGALPPKDAARVARFFCFYAKTKLLRGTRARFEGLDA
jgi:inorganic pyrophosphatase